MYLLKIFMVYCVIGFIFEHLIYLFNKKNGKSGIFYGPYTPIYGIGSIIILSIAKLVFYFFEVSMFIEILIIFFSVITILTITELVAGVFIEKTLDVVFWDYSMRKFSYGHYICLSVSLIWGFLGLFLVYIFNPFMMPFINIIPSYVVFIFYMFFIADALFSIISKTKIKDYLIKALR